MARAKKTTTAKAKAPAKPAAAKPKAVAKVPDGAAQLVDALNADYAAVCKRVHELGVADPDGRKDPNEIQAHQNSLDDLKNGKYEYGRVFKTAKAGQKHTKLQYEDGQGVTVVGFIDNKTGELLKAADEKTPGNPAGYNLNDSNSLKACLGQADWGANFIHTPQS